MRYRGALLATAILAAPFAASAQPISGLYVNGNAGFDLLQNVEVTPIGPGFGPGYKRIQPGAGFTGIGAVGWAFGNGLRLELQGDYIQNNIRHFNGTPFPTAATNNLQTYGVMGNAVFDLDIGMPFLYPYLGLGAGYQFDPPEQVLRSRAGRRLCRRQQRHHGVVRRTGDRRLVVPGPECPRPVGHHRISVHGHPRRREVQQRGVIAGGNGAGHAQAAQPVPQPVPGRRSLRLQRSAAACSRGGARSCADTGARALLPGVLRLGQGDADRRARDRSSGRRPRARPTCSTRASR